MPDANVLFKRGQHSQLFNNDGTPKITIQDGTFYLTEDTNRLYVGQRASTAANAEVKLIELNKSITTVNSIANLPTTGVQIGQFYYVTGTNLHQGDTATNGNILAVVTGFDTENNNKPIWVQVNPDTNTDTNDNDRVSSFSIEKDQQNSTSSSLVYKWSLIQEDINGNPYSTSAESPLSYTGSFAISNSDISTLAGAHVGLVASDINNNATVISTTGGGSDTATSFTLQASTNVLLTKNTATSAIVISAVDTKYKQATDTANKVITLETDDANQTGVGSTSYVNGSLINIDVTGNTAATVTISHATVTTSTHNATTAATLAFGGSTTVIEAIHTDASGHIDGVTTKTITMPAKPTYTIESVSADNTGKIAVELSDGNNTVSTTSGQDLYYTINGTAVYNQGNLGSFYTKSEIDTMMTGLDALTYKGTLGTNGTIESLPTTAACGDTYKVSTSGTYAGYPCKVGDLIIATGAEYQDTDSTATATYVNPTAQDHDTKIGTIVSPINWTVVANGDDTDTQYELSVANNVISLSDNIAGSNPDTVTFAVPEGGRLSVSTSGSTITYSHTTATVTGGTTANLGNQNLTYGNTVSVVNGIKVDNCGHINSIYTSTLTMPSAPTDTKESFEVTASTSNASGYITLTEDGENGNDKGKITFQNGNKTEAVVTQDSTSNQAIVTINHTTLSTTAIDSTTTPVLIDATNGVNVITGVSADSYGHVNNYTISKIILPDSVKTKLGGNADTNNSAVASAGTNKAKVAFILDDGDNGQNLTGAAVPEFTFSSSSLQISPTAATSTTPGNIAVDIVWGSFN